MKNVKFLYDNFCHRRDAYTVMCDHPWQDRGNYYKRVYKPLTIELVEKHLTGDITIGVFPTRIEDQTARFACFDVDHTEEAYLKKAIFWAKQYGNPIIEESGAEGRYHIWLLFEPKPLKEVRKIFEGKAGCGMDFFPNQDVVINDFYFELPIKLPLGWHRVAKCWSHFVDKDLKPMGIKNVL